MASLKQKLVQVYGDCQIIIEDKLRRLEGMEYKDTGIQGRIDHWRSFRTTMEDLEEMVRIVGCPELSREFYNQVVVVGVQKCTHPFTKDLAVFWQSQGHGGAGVDVCKGVLQEPGCRGTKSRFLVNGVSGNVVFS